jgi:predicted TIM-barrel fold metal-dependent hydrolase
MPIIDSHLHFVGDHAESVALLEKLDIQLLNICVNAGGGINWRAREGDAYRKLIKAHPGRYLWCTTFELPAEGEDVAAYGRRVIEAVDQDVADGAIACKVWKNVGMDFKRADGTYVMVDDAVFEPLFAHLEKAGIPLLMHIGEPMACWRPIEEYSPHQSYYKTYPQWHMYGRTDVPDHAANMRARDNVVARHPKLHCIGAHLGSLEYSLAEMAKRFDAYANFAVDTSARIGDLAYADRDELIAFLEKYQDRVMFGTDVVFRQPHSTMTAAERAEKLAAYESNVNRHLKFFGTDEVMTIANKEVRGVKLPKRIFEKVFFENVLRWYPGVGRQRGSGV